MADDPAPALSADAHDHPQDAPLDVPLDLGRLAREQPAWARVEVVAEVGSTNQVVAERARAGEPEGLVVTTEWQRAGRGRVDRRWEAPPRSGLASSLLVRPTAPPATWPWLPLLTGLAVASTLDDHGYAARLKWPNDVLLEAPAGGRAGKVCGILVELVDTPAGPAVVVGVGLNVALPAERLPVETATSLAAVDPARRPPSRTDLLLGLLGHWRATYDRWLEAGPAGVADTYAAACTSVGRTVRVELPGGGVLEGRSTGLDEGGRLLVEGPRGVEAVGAGDVVHLRTP